jgi:hypothetical protein
VSNIFRDPTEGASARRADLLRRRRDELVMMPHAIRRVYVARRARTAASAAIALFGTALLVVAAKPAWAGYLAKGLPGINPAVLCTLIIAMWIVGVLTYFAARAFDEHRFAIAMTRLVMPSHDINDDVERLSHENPDLAARDMAHWLEVRSAALPVLAAGVLLPVTALYAGAIYRTGGWPVIAQFEGAVAVHAKMLIGCAAVGGVLAVAMTRRAVRLPIVAPITLCLALVPAAFAPLATLWLVPIAMLLATVALVVRTLRVERELLQADDPATGSEVFTIRGFVRQLRATLAPIGAFLRSVRPVWVLVVGVLVIAGFTAARFFQVNTKANPQVQAAVLTPVTTQLAPPDLGPTGSKWVVSRMSYDGYKIELDLADERPIWISALGGVSQIPVGWQARIAIDQLEGMALKVSPLPEGEPTSISIEDDAMLGSGSCGMTQYPLGLRIQGAPGHYVLHVQPLLQPYNCNY